MKGIKRIKRPLKTEKIISTFSLKPTLIKYHYEIVEDMIIAPLFQHRLKDKKPVLDEVYSSFLPTSLGLKISDFIVCKKDDLKDNRC